MIDVISRDETNHGLCLIDVYSAPGDLYDSWDIVHPDEEGNYPRNPDAGYGPYANNRDTSDWEFIPVHILEVTERLERNGHTWIETTIYADGLVIATSGGHL